MECRILLMGNTVEMAGGWHTCTVINTNLRDGHVFTWSIITYHPLAHSYLYTLPAHTAHTTHATPYTHTQFTQKNHSRSLNILQQKTRVVYGGVEWPL